MGYKPYEEPERKYGDAICFARRWGHCMVLKEMPASKTCPFRKPKRHITDGKEYTIRKELTR